MAKGDLDRRSARTRAQLEGALGRLVLTTTYEAITVDALCAAANVGRSTFYGHYAGKDDLKRGVLRHLRQDLAAAPGTGPRPPFQFIPGLFAHAQDRRREIRAQLDGRGADIALAEIRGILTDLVRQDLAGQETRTVQPRAPDDAVASFVVAGLLGLLVWWLRAEPLLPAADVAALGQRLLTPGSAPAVAPAP